MGRRHFIWAGTLVIAGVGVLAGSPFSSTPTLRGSLLPCAAADEAKPAPATDADERRKPLPANFGKLGITDDQRAKLQSVQDDYETRLEELRKQLKDLVAERDQKMESLLTSGQKLRLKELRDMARAKSAKPKTETTGDR